MRVWARAPYVWIYSVTSPNTTNHPAQSATLIRFVTDGLIATIDSYRATQLPLHRLTWELNSRIDTLAELHPATRTLTRLRWLHHDINNLHTTLATTGRTDLTTDEQNSLTVTLVSLRTALATLGPDTPPDPTDATLTVTASNYRRTG
jgi:hypothetical protein